MTVNGWERSANRPLPFNDKILGLTFNQNITGLSMGTVSTYALFTINQKPATDEYELLPMMNPLSLDCEAIYIIERLFSSSLVVFVTKRAPRKLEVWHWKKGVRICSYSFLTTICAAKLNRSRLIVCLEECIHIVNLRDMRILLVIYDIPSNIRCACALSLDENQSYLAYPNSLTTGEIQIYDATNLTRMIVISAHESPLAAMTFDMDGIRIASASTEGTVIRVHHVIDGVCLFEFRREVQQAETIYSLAFSPDSMFLAASSNIETAHIYRTSKETSTSMTPSSDGLNDPAYNRPTLGVSRQDRSFATAHLPSTGKKTTIAMKNFDEKLILFAAGYDGVVSIYEINTIDGGECKQLHQYNLFNMLMNSVNQQSTSAEVERETTNEPAASSAPESSEPPNQNTS